MIRMKDFVLILFCACALSFFDGAIVEGNRLEAKASPAPSCKTGDFGGFVDAVWKPDDWARGAPRPATFRAYHRKLSCAAPKNRGDLVARWRAARVAFNARRRAELFAERWAPYYGCTVAYPGDRLCAHSAIDIYIVQCESGGDYTPTIPGGLNFGGKYGLLDQTYHEYGGRFNHANEGPPHEQDRIARRLFEDRGYSPWACA